MKQPYVLQPHLTRFVRFFDAAHSAVPAALNAASAAAPDLAGFPYPLPSRKRDYTCFAEGANGVVWYGAKTGLTRYEPNAARPEDIVQYFSADRDLLDNNVLALFAEGDNAWAKTEQGVAFIEMRMITVEEKANILLEETLNYVERRGMVSQRGLKKPRDPESREPWAHSDNDGCFTAGFAMGELFHYAVLKREKGEDDPETQRIRAIATRAVEACLLLMYIPGRGDGFIARTYHTSDEPVPDDGLFFRKNGGKATCIETRAATRMGLIGKVIEAGAPIPARLSKLYTDLGFTDDDITYKADTSSDEVSLHYLNIYFAHEILGPGDPELDELMKTAAKASMQHILDHGYEMHDCTGKPTTWAKWSPGYFADGLGWCDGCLNSAEILMYLRVTMHITGEKAQWQEAFDHLISLGYGDLTEMHCDRFWHASMAGNVEPREDLMYGDNMLSVAAFWGLIPLETDDTLRRKYQNGFLSWRNTQEAEHNPAYDFPLLATCPEADIDMEFIATWFYRFNPSRLAAGVSTVGRHDLARGIAWGGYEFCSYLLPPDECFIAKYDRDPLQYRDSDSGGMNCIESCYVYTNAYWAGRYYGFIQ